MLNVAFTLSIAGYNFQIKYGKAPRQQTKLSVKINFRSDILKFIEKFLFLLYKRCCVNALAIDNGFPALK